MDVALATCLTLPEPDPDAMPLVDALTRAGLEAQLVPWDGSEPDWPRARLTLLRSTWNYPLRPEDFLAWAERVAKRSHLFNPIEAVRWNLHKRYLLELERRGVPIAPTVLVPRGSTTSLDAILDEKGWDVAVVKPAVSAASYRTLRVARREWEVGEAHLKDLVASRDALVQRYLPSVEGYGERALMWIDGTITHAVRKTPRFSGEIEAVSAAVPITRNEEELARAAIGCVASPLLYARIDVAPGPEGLPVVMELEVIEPSLFFEQGPRALELLVAGILRRLG
jgi:hypothetical protein